MFDYDDEDLDGLEDRAAYGVRKDEIVAAAAPLIDEIRIQQEAHPEVLQVVRDLFIAGKDIDAVAVLAKELGMVPSPLNSKRALATLPPSGIVLVGSHQHTIIDNPLATVIVKNLTDAPIAVALQIRTNTK